MSTVLDLCTNAALDIGVIAGGDILSASDAVDILGKLNDIGLSFDGQGIHCGWQDVALTDDFPLDAVHRRGLRAMLAVDIAPLFGVSPSAEVQRQALLGWQRLKADYAAPSLTNFSDDVLRLPSQRMYY